MQAEPDEEPKDPQVRELQEELSKLKSLQTHLGYRYLLEIANAQLETRKQDIFLRPLSAMDQVLEQEYKKGEVAGIKLFTEIVDIRAHDLEEQIKLALEEQENDNVERELNDDGN